MEILTIILTVNYKGIYEDIRNMFTKAKSFDFAVSPITLGIMLNDIGLTVDDVQLCDDMEYNIYSKTLHITCTDK